MVGRSDDDLEADDPTASAVTEGEEEDDEEWEDESDDEEDDDDAVEAEFEDLNSDQFFCQEVVVRNLPEGEGLPLEVCTTILDIDAAPHH